MKCIAEQNWTGHGVRIWLFEDGPTVRKLVVPEQGMWRWDEVDPGAEKGEPSLTLPDAALEAIIREASGLVPASDATTAHLQDTIGVRDQLMQLVASSFPPPRQVIDMVDPQ